MLFLTEKNLCSLAFIYAVCLLVSDCLVFPTDEYILVDILLQNVKRNLDFMVPRRYEYFNTKTWSLLLNLKFDPNNYLENACIEFD